MSCKVLRFDHEPADATLAASHQFEQFGVIVAAYAHIERERFGFSGILPGPRRELDNIRSHADLLPALTISLTFQMRNSPRFPLRLLHMVTFFRFPLHLCPMALGRRVDGAVLRQGRRGQQKTRAGRWLNIQASSRSAAVRSRPRIALRQAARSAESGKSSSIAARPPKWVTSLVATVLPSTLTAVRPISMKASTPATNAIASTGSPIAVNTVARITSEPEGILAPPLLAISTVINIVASSGQPSATL